MDRKLASQARNREFESPWGHHKPQTLSADYTGSGAKTIMKQTRKSGNREYHLQSYLGWLCNYKEEFDYEVAPHRTGPPFYKWDILTDRLHGSNL